MNEDTENSTFGAGYLLYDSEIVTERIWLVVEPDNESYDRKSAGAALDRLKAEENLSIEWTGNTRDHGEGREEEYFVTGFQNTIDSIYVMFWDRCVEEAEQAASKE